MKIKLFLAFLLCASVFSACDDNTDTVGISLNSNTDGVVIGTGTYNVSSRSILADSVLSSNTTGYLGKVRDPETGAYVTGDFMTQFYSLENYEFPSLDSLVAVNADGSKQVGKVQADSCKLRLYFNKFYGDSTQTMKMTVYEMGKAMNENRHYYSNFDPLKEGYVRTDGIHQDKVYDLVNYNVPKHLRDSTGYVPYIDINLNEAYTDKDGKSYNNYGTYILSKYYEDKSNFKDAFSFRNNVVPGFILKSKSGLGSMAYIEESLLTVYFHYLSSDSVYEGLSRFWGTEEVLQSTTITNDNKTLQKLAADESCTYLKTPSGIFTELTLPVEEIMSGHESDSITSAKMIIHRLNNTVQSDYSLSVPSSVLMIPEDSLYSFFENDEVYNNTNSFVANWGYSSTTSSTDNNAYTFNNISGIISAMYRSPKTSPNWNKVVLVPVTISTTISSSYYSTSTIVTHVSNDMSLSSTRLVKGTSTNSPIQLNVIYSRFK